MLSPISGLKNKYLRASFAAFICMSSLFIASPAQAEEVWWAQENWENDFIEVTAPEGWEFAYIRGWYGARDEATCGYDVSPVLERIALGATAFSFRADNNTFGDSCPGVYKLFRFTWGIIPVNVVVPPVEPPVEPVDPPVEPVDPLVEPVDPIEPPIDPVDPVEPVDPVDPPVDPEPPIEPVEPPVEPEKPVITPEPPVIPEEPIVAPVRPVELEKPIVEVAVEKPSPAEVFSELAEIEPSKLTDQQVEQLQESAFAVLEESEAGSAEYEEALDALFLVAQADDIVIDEELANTPVIGAAIVGLTNAINFLGNIGADISPKVREESEKVVVGAVIAGQIAQVAGAAAVSTPRRNGK